MEDEENGGRKGDKKEKKEKGEGEKGRGRKRKEEEEGRRDHLDLLLL